MLHEDGLKELLSQPSLSNADKILIILAVDPGASKSVKAIKSFGYNAGLRKIREWNVSAILGRAKGMAIRSADGWELNASGLKHVGTLAGPSMGSPALKVAASLRSHLSKIANSDVLSFVEEAIACYEARLFRAAVVLSWVGAIGLLYDFVIKNKLADFNKEATARNSKWKPARTSDDLARMQESDFLDILDKISVIGKSVKLELGVCLTLRNGCGHPNSLKIADHRVAAHIESLILNIFSRFV